MAFRVARGLFRLWLVLSVLWIGGVGVMTWRTFPIDTWRAAPPPPAGYVLDPRPTSYIAALDKERCAAIQSAILMALAPPALVLALGSALIWAFRGFR
jgi:hypothetical protein